MTPWQEEILRWQHQAVLAQGQPQVAAAVVSSPAERVPLEAVNSIMGGGGGSAAGEAGASPWDALFSLLGQGHGAIQGNDPSAPMVPGNRTPHSGDNVWSNVGAGAGTAIGSIFGFPAAGRMAGQNVGATFNDLFNGDIRNLGLDVSQNLPPIPGMRDEGWKGLVNGATGLPIGWLLDKIF